MKPVPSVVRLKIFDGAFLEQIGDDLGHFGCSSIFVFGVGEIWKEPVWFVGIGILLELA